MEAKFTIAKSVFCRQLGISVHAYEKLVSEGLIANYDWRIPTEEIVKHAIEVKNALEYFDRPTLPQAAEAYGITKHYLYAIQHRLSKYPKRLDKKHVEKLQAELDAIEAETFNIPQLAKACGLTKGIAYSRLCQLGLITPSPIRGKREYDRQSCWNEFKKAVLEYTTLSGAKVHAKKLKEAGLYSYGTAAKYLGCPMITLRQWTDISQVVPKPSTKFGAYCYFNKADLDRIKEIKKEYFRERKQKGK
ncbi:MAG: MerR family transcriptional regulator [Gemmatales bacterium]